MSYMYFSVGEQAVADVFVETKMATDESRSKMNNHAAQVDHNHSKQNAHDGAAPLWIFLIQVVNVESIRLRQYHCQQVKHGCRLRDDVRST